MQINFDFQKILSKTLQFPFKLQIFLISSLSRFPLNQSKFPQTFPPLFSLRNFTLTRKTVLINASIKLHHLRPKNIVINAIQLIFARGFFSPADRAGENYVNNFICVAFKWRRFHNPPWMFPVREMIKI